MTDDEQNIKTYSTVNSVFQTNWIQLMSVWRYRFTVLCWIFGVEPFDSTHFDCGLPCLIIRGSDRSLHRTGNKMAGMMSHQQQLQGADLQLVAKIRVLLLFNNNSSDKNQSNSSDDDDGIARPSRAVATAANERRWVALLLLTRVHDDEGFLRVLCCHGKDLVSWTTSRLLQLRGVQEQHQQQPLLKTNAKHMKASTIHCDYHLYRGARLIAQLVYRMVHAIDAVSACHIEQEESMFIMAKYVLNAWGEGLLQFYCSVMCNESSASVLVARIEILLALQAWMESCNDTPKLDDMLLKLAVTVEKMEEVEECSMEDIAAGPSTTKENGKQQQNNQQEDIMDQTVTALLDQTSLVNIINETDSILSSLSLLQHSHHEQRARLFLHHGVRVAAVENPHVLPLFYQPLLSKWLLEPSKKSKRRHPHEVRRLWAEVLLVTLQARAQSLAAVAASASLQTMLNKDSTFSADLVRFIFACVIDSSDDESSSSTKDLLRVAAWSTVGTLVQVVGWDWLFVRPTNSSLRSSGSLGVAGKLCALIRLAAGEWKIQLAALVYAEDQQQQNQQNDENDPQSPSCLFVPLIDACGVVLVEAVKYVVQLAEQTNHESSIPLLSGDSILHIRRSLEESLNVTGQYLGLSEQRLNQVDCAAIRVFGALLTEMDVFENTLGASMSETMKVPDQECVSLQALLVALRISMADVESQEHLLPGLANVLASAHGVESREKLLEDYGLLSEALLLFFESHCRSATNLSSASWACQVIEMWVSMEKGIFETSRLQAFLIQYLERMSQQQKRTAEMVDALSAVVSCYAALQGDEPPGEPDSTILKQVLDHCAGFDQ